MRISLRRHFQLLAVPLLMLTLVVGSTMIVLLATRPMIWQPRSIAKQPHNLSKWF